MKGNPVEVLYKLFSQEIIFHGKHENPRCIVDAELIHKVFAVRIHCVCAQAELVGDLLVG